MSTELRLKTLRNYLDGRGFWNIEIRGNHLTAEHIRGTLNVNAYDGEWDDIHFVFPDNTLSCMEPGACSPHEIADWVETL